VHVGHRGTGLDDAAAAEELRSLGDHGREIRTPSSSVTARPARRRRGRRPGLWRSSTGAVGRSSSRPTVP
jgi:hypothetical protein